MADAGFTGKTSRWGFLFEKSRYTLVVDALRAANICAAVSPLHDMDVWDRPDILKYMESWTRQRKGTLFYYDEKFDGNGFTFKECMNRTDVPLYALWPCSMARDTDAKHYEQDGTGTWFIKELPINGEVKKPHYHAMVNLGYAIPMQQFLNQTKIEQEWIYYWEPVNKWESLLRYYAHMDSPEKARYRETDILSLYGFDLSPVYRQSEIEKTSDFEYVYALVRSLPSCNMLTLSDALIQQGKGELARKLSARSGYWREILRDQAQIKRMSEGTEIKPDFRKTDYSPDSVEIVENEADKEHLSRLLEQIG